MQANAYNVIHFLDDTEYSKDAALTVSPPPETLIRCFMLFKGAREPQAGCRGLGQLPAVPRERRGFTVVEWGGMNVDGHRA